MTKSTIMLNHRSYPFREGMTIGSVMAENNFDFAGIIVRINGLLIEEEVWQYAAITAGDNVEIIHIFGGG
ncbi:MAG: sulfur carrier protein ThiS [Oscillospiraceae bacterium]|nr:sulfur carrier protein ThiS [Oscillospiraceae bacterium]